MTIGKILNCEVTFVQQCRNSACKIMKDGFDCNFKIDRCSCFSEDVHLQMFSLEEVKANKMKD